MNFVAVPIRGRVVSHEKRLIQGGQRSSSNWIAPNVPRTARLLNNHVTRMS